MEDTTRDIFKFGSRQICRGVSPVDWNRWIVSHLCNGDRTSPIQWESLPLPQWR